MTEIRVSRSERSATIRLIGKDKSWLLCAGPGYAARLSVCGRDHAREISVGPSRRNCANVISDLEISGRDIRRGVRAEFASGIVRTDALRFDAKGGSRSASWAFPTGEAIVSSYADGIRDTVVYQNKAEERILARHISEAKQNGPDRYTVTGHPIYELPGGEIIVGDIALDEHLGPHSSTGAMFVTPNGDHMTVIFDNGTLFQSGFVHVDANHTSAQSFIHRPDGSGASQKQDTYFHQDGSTAVKTSLVETDADGHSSWGKSVAQSGLDGGFMTISGSQDKDGTEQKSAYTNDGAGNESETTVTIFADGSVIIETRSKDAEGNRSGSAQRYDKDGNPVPGDGDGGGGDDGGDSGGGGTDGSDDGDGGGGGGGTDGGNDGDGGDGGGDDDGRPSGGGDEGQSPLGDGSMPPKPNMYGGYPPGTGNGGELPAYDGSDPPPQPVMLGSGGALFAALLAELTPAYGGGGTGWDRTGGAVDAARVSAAIARDVNGVDDGDGTGRPMPEEDAPVNYALRAAILATLDPENNPKALIECLTRLGGLPGNSGATRAAEAAVAAAGS